MWVCMCVCGAHAQVFGPVYAAPLTALPNGQFEEDFMVYLREQYGEVFVVERGSFNHLMSTVKRKFRRHTYIDMGACV